MNQPAVTLAQGVSPTPPTNRKDSQSTALTAKDKKPADKSARASTRSPVPHFSNKSQILASPPLPVQSPAPPLTQPPPEAARSSASGGAKSKTSLSNASCLGEGLPLSPEASRKSGVADATFASPGNAGKTSSARGSHLGNLKQESNNPTNPNHEGSDEAGGMTTRRVRRQSQASHASTAGKRPSMTPSTSGRGEGLPRDTDTYSDVAAHTQRRGASEEPARIGEGNQF
jgi:hypothetical protein